MKQIERHQLHQEILDYLKKPTKVLLIEGVRQTGKTTAILEASSSKPHTLVTLSDETFASREIREAATFESFCQKLKQPYSYDPKQKHLLILDEAQRSPYLYSFLMQIERQWKKTPVILSGSVMGAFFKRHANKNRTSPAGRVHQVICRPFSFYEFLDYRGHHALLEDLKNWNAPQTLSSNTHEEAMRCFFNYLSTGGFPEAIKRGDDIEALYDYLQNLLSFFWQDADRYLSEVMGSERHQYGRLMESLFRSIGRHTGDPTKRSSLISTHSPAYRKLLPSLLDAAQDWHFVFQLATERKAFSSKQGFSSKKYLWDVGVLNHFLNLSRPVSWESDPSLLAKLLESSVAEELVFYIKQSSRLASWKSHPKQNKEMDFLAHYPKQDIGLEVKASTKPSRRALSQVKEYLKINPKAPAYAIYLGPYEQEKLAEQTVHWIPPYLLGQV